MVLVTTALDLPVAQVVEAWAARCRQEDGVRDHKQRLGMEECRAWTQEPILRAFQVQLVALTRLRDLRRLFWRYGIEFSQFMLALEELEKIPQPRGLHRKFAGRAA